MLADRRLLIKVMAMAPIGAAAFGFLAATFFPWNSLKQVSKPIVNRAPLLEPAPKPSPSVLPNAIKPLPSSYQSKVFEDVAVPPSQKVVALSFDDGPLPGPTERILKILKDNNIKATFFIIGQNAKLHPELVKKIFNDGHTIGNHSWTHPYNRQTLAGAAAEIDKTSIELAKTIGSKPNLFRPPGGLMHTGLAEYAKSEKMGIVIWSADAQDYRAKYSPDRLLKNLFKEIKPGGIILMHDGGVRRTNTSLALPILIERLRKQGYRFVTIPELISMDTHSSIVAQPKAKPTVIAKKSNSKHTIIAKHISKPTIITKF